MRTGLTHELVDHAIEDCRMSRLEDEVNSLASQIQSNGSQTLQKSMHGLMSGSNCSHPTYSSGQKPRTLDRFQADSLQSASSKKGSSLRSSKLEVNVYCRLKPLEFKALYVCIYRPPKIGSNNKPPRMNDSLMTATRDSIIFTHRGNATEFPFRRVFTEEASQIEVYEGAVRKSVLSAVYEGQSAVVFGFGVSGSGKTHTMLGSQRDGILQIAFKELLQTSRHSEAEPTANKENSLSDKQKGLKEVKVTGVKVSFSAYELHQDKMYDLLEGTAVDRNQLSGSKTALNAERGFVIESVGSEHELQVLLDRVEKTRKKRGTFYNDHSSRSHIFLRLHGVTELTNLSTGSYHTRHI